tara:strand:- start:481 stop:681 length:201 start_codon:yes stop_codon:yes gene_type:complete
MNERIKQLANKANEDIGYKIPMIQAKQLHKLMQKFAVLIVKECANVADGGWAAPGIQIKQHFGVEE